MNITGNLVKSLYNKSGESFIVDALLTLDNISSGRFDLGFSGDTNFELQFGSGLVYYNNKLIESYQKNVPLKFRLEFEDEFCDIYIKDKPISFQNSVGDYNYSNVYINTTGPTGVLELTVSGNLPNITLPPTGIMDDIGFVYIPVVINDTGKVLEVYNIVLDRQNEIKPFCFDHLITGSGNFQFKGNPLITGLFEQTFNIYTNGGVISTGMTIFRQTGITGGYLQFFPMRSDNFLVDTNVYGPVTGEYMMSTLDLQDFPYFDIRLEYVSGSGFSSFNVTGSGNNGTGYISGNITGSGFLSGHNIIGTISYNSGISASNLPYAGYGYGLEYITGTFVKNFVTEIYGSGVYSGSLVPATGLYSGSITGTILQINSGVYFYSGVNVSGTPHRPYFISGEVSGSGYFTGMVGGSITGSGYILKSGNNLTMIGEVLFTGNKTFLNTWKLRTGLFTDVMEDYYTNNWYDSDSYSDEGIVADAIYPADHYRVFTHLVYDNPYKDRPIDVVNLYYSNGIRSGVLLITGTYTGNV